MIYTRRDLTLCINLLLLCVSISDPVHAATQNPGIKDLPPVIDKPARYETLPDVKFETRGNQYATYYTTTGMILAGFVASASDQTPQYFELLIFLRNAQRNFEITTLNPRLSRTDFFGSESPSWLTNIPDYAKVKYSNPYPDIDLLFQVRQRKLDLGCVISPGGDPGKIRFLVNGAQTVQITNEGNLLLKVHDFTFELQKPMGYQTLDEGSAPVIVDARYVLTGKNEIGLQIDPYNSKRPLIIVSHPAFQATMVPR